MGNDFAFSLNALYVRGYNALGYVDYNPLVPALGPGRRPNDAGGRPFTSAPLQQYTNYGGSWYKGLTVALSKRFSHGYEFLLSYTFSKAEDEVSDLFTVQAENQGFGRNPADPTGLPLGFDPAHDRGPSENDQRHRAVLSGVFGTALVHARWPLSSAPAPAVRSRRWPGQDLNGDGVRTDRARTDPRDPSSSVGRNSELTEAHFNADVRLSAQVRHGRAGLGGGDRRGVQRVQHRQLHASPTTTFGPGRVPRPAAPGRVADGPPTACTRRRWRRARCSSRSSSPSRP